MRRPNRIQVKPRWADDEEVEPSRERPPPPGQGVKLLALAGMALFWLHYLGVLGTGDDAGVDTGFLLFAGLQVPLLWAWLRHHSGR